MKTALVLFTNPMQNLDSDYLGKICNSFTLGGYSIDCIEILSLSDDLGFKRCIDRFKDTVDNLVVVYNEQVKFNIKKIIADQMDSELVENENAVKIIDALSKAHGRTYSEQYALMPMDATLIPNISGAFQGFMIDDNEFTFVLLPGDIEQYKVALEKYLFAYLDKKFCLEKKRLVLKYFGKQNLLDSAIEQSRQVTQESITITYVQSFGDFTISLVGKESGVNQVARQLISLLKDNLYAEKEVSLGERLFDLLKLRNLKIATAESFTGGRIVTSLINNVGASDHVYEGIVSYTEQSKSARLMINPKDIEKDGVVSAKTAYHMATGLLSTGKVDLAISTTGFAGPYTEHTSDPVGLAYIGIGMLDGVHTYRLNLSGSREEITETAKNTALFLAIKKLKNIK